MLDDIVGKRISLPQQFTGTVLVESVEILEDTVILMVKTESGEREEALLTLEQAQALEETEQQDYQPIVDANRFFLFIESARIKTAYDFDPHFAVSLSGVRPLPHQLEAVYQRILPQARLRFLLADDPGAGKTIMGGLLLKELKLRHAVDRILILTPAPLTIQWQDELRSKFSETFEVINSNLVKNQLAGNPWERFRQCIASVDFAKRDDVLPSILQVEWDLVIIDEAHKCSARTQGDELRKTGRYKLAEALSGISERILLLTATPHQGNKDQFHNFLRLLDPEQFISSKINPQILQLEESPWFLRRIKEELKDFNGNKLFKERYPITIPFELSYSEKRLYDEVTTYINRYLGRTQGKKKGSVALARTVLQRRLASSLNAIYSSLKKREKRFADLLEELADLSPSEQHQRLMNLGRITDPEMEDDDYEGEELDEIAIDSTVAEQIDQLQEELMALRQLVRLAQQTIEIGEETKLNALKDCLESSELQDLKDGRGKLLIFTEHRDTLDYLKENLTQWGYSTCEIHGGMSAVARKEAQNEFRVNKQICLATEAAGEGINLQFCHLMINYDIPWSPHRLEQRMGRIHRIGQPQDVYIFNFVATNTVEGNVLNKLLTKLDEIRGALGDKVFDVIGQLLQLNDIHFEDLVKEASYGKAEEDEAVEKINRLDPKILEELEQATGIALATSSVDFSQVRRTQARDYLSEERRLMPRYVEEFFRRACDYLNINLDVRADGLWRINYLKEEFRSPHLESVRKLGLPESKYHKFTFYKEKLEEASHGDAEFVSPGHPLFGAVAERLDRQLVQTVGYQSALFLDADAFSPYRIHFFEVQVAGQNIKGNPTILRAKMVAIREKEARKYEFISTDCLHDFTPLDPNIEAHSLKPPTPEEQQALEKWLKVKTQMKLMQEEREKRERELHIRQDYLTKAMEAAISEAKQAYITLSSKVAKGDDTYRVARDNAQNKVRTLTERYQNKLQELNYLQLVRPGRLVYLGTALVIPPTEPISSGMRNDPEVEAIAMEFVMNYERERGWTPEDVSQRNDGSGFDIRSEGQADEMTGNLPIRRIEVKGRAGMNQDVSLTSNEWRRAQQLGDTYWLYVVWNCQGEQPQLLTIQNPALVLAGEVKEIKQVTRYIVGAEALAKIEARESAARHEAI